MELISKHMTKHNYWLTVTSRVQYLNVYFKSITHPPSPARQTLVSSLLVLPLPVMYAKSHDNVTMYLQWNMTVLLSSRVRLSSLFITDYQIFCNEIWCMVITQTINAEWLTNSGTQQHQFHNSNEAAQQWQYDRWRLKINFSNIGFWGLGFRLKNATALTRSTVVPPSSGTSHWI
jgi:hypothetical protein